MKNRILFILVIISLLFLVTFTSNVHSTEEIKQEPIYETESLDGIRGYLGLDLRDAFRLENENYIWINNDRNKHVLVIKKESNIMFVGVNIYMAYMIVALKNDETSEETWLLFQVEPRNTESPVTRMYFEMKQEFIDFIKNGCPAQREKI